MGNAGLEHLQRLQILLLIWAPFLRPIGFAIRSSRLRRDKPFGLGVQETAGNTTNLSLTIKQDYERHKMERNANGTSPNWWV